MNGVVKVLVGICLMGHLRPRTLVVTNPRNPRAKATTMMLIINRLFRLPLPPLRKPLGALLLRPMETSRRNCRPLSRLSTRNLLIPLHQRHLVTSAPLQLKNLLLLPSLFNRSFEERNLDDLPRRHLRGAHELGFIQGQSRNLTKFWLRTHTYVRLSLQVCPRRQPLQ
jgi:hypothetical protein